MAHKAELFAYPFCDQPQMEKDFERLFEKEIAPDVWFIEGYAGAAFYTAPPSSNIFVLRDKDMVLLLDTGNHPYYRQKILRILQKYARQGARRLVLMVTHGHWDHGRNNDVILETEYSDIRFLLPEPEIQVLDQTRHVLEDLTRLEKYFNPYLGRADNLRQLNKYARKFEEYSNPEYRDVWKYIENLPSDADRPRVRSALWLLYSKVLTKGSRYMAEFAEILPLDSRKKRIFGHVEVDGWQVGRFFVIHDGSQSPGHICLYDPLNKLMITGDATLGINPVYLDGSLKKNIGILRKCRIMAEQGYIHLATDSHRSQKWWTERFKTWGVKPLGPLYLVDMAKGQDECVAFFQMWEEYFSDLNEETLTAHLRIGEATVPEIVEELSKSTSKAVLFKKSYGMPYKPNRLETLVAMVLAENGASRRKVGDRILFTPRDKWEF
jgi:glyoxylase-like metal-dependent hydrolase (beta-lactamase superfamily II)